MTLNYKAIFKIFGTIFLILGIAMIPSLLISLRLHEKATVSAFIITIIPLIIIGILMIRFIRPENTVIKTRDGIFIVGFAWFLASAISAVPLVLSGAIPSFPDAIFETASGYTTTGASILTNIEALSKGALFWRSSTQWLGGMGILMFTIALLPALGINGQHIADAETTGPTKGKLTARMSDSAKILYQIYIGITLLMVIMLCLGGMSLYDAVLHTFGAVSTSGFSSYNTSIAHFDSFYIEMVIAIFMAVCGINFNLFYQIIRAKLREVGRDSELRFYLASMGVAVLLITVFLRITNVYGSLLESFRYSFFQVSSIMTTTGFATTDFALWPSFCILILILLMFFGGCSSSTAGAIKCVRIFVMFKLIRQNIYSKLHPRAVTTINLNGKSLSPDIVAGISGFIALYIAMIVMGVCVLTVQGIDLMTAFTACAATLGNVGPGFGLVGPVLNYSFFNSGTTLFLAVYMIMGRLEIYTVLLLFTRAFWRPER